MYDIEPYAPMEVGFRRIARRVRARRAPSFRRSAGPKTAGSGIIAGSQRGGFLGLGSASIDAGATAVLRTTVQKPFQGERLVISATAVGLVLQNFTVGVTPQLAGIDAAPVEAFAADAVNVDFDIDPAGPGLDIAVSITNPTAAAINVSAALIGVRGQ